ncbi:hypothetical protein VCHENC02_1359B, partial [Vibrio harveyi]
SSVRM